MGGCYALKIDFWNIILVTCIQFDVIKKITAHGLFLEFTTKFTGHRTAVNIADAATVNAEVFCINHTGHIFCIECMLQLLDYLHSKAFLYLGALSVIIYDAVHFRKAYNGSVRNVSDMCPAYDGKQMMLTCRVKGNVFSTSISPY